jgi:pimeloyl-ACP methyl ester carboxylesterase
MPDQPSAESVLAPSATAATAQVPLSTAAPSSPSSSRSPSAHTARRPRLESWVCKGLRWIESISPALAGQLAFQLFLTPLRNYFPVCPRDEAMLGQAEARSLRHGRYRRQYLRTFSWGEAGRPTVLLLHGWMASASHMIAFVQPLLDAGFRVIAMDAPAHGRSSGLQTSMPEFGEAICLVARQLGPIDGIVAHSFGAASCLFLLHHKPHSIAVNSLVMLAPPSQVKQMMDIVIRALGGSDRLRAEMQRCFLRRYGNPVEHYAIENMVQTNALPGLVVHDQGDRLVDFAEGAAIAQAWPNAEFIATEGLGHGGILREPGILEEVVRFQKTHCLRPPAPRAAYPNLADGPAL